MSLRYKGAVLSATPPTVNAEAYGSAKGIWTMQQQYQYEGAGTWPSPFTPVYVEDVFSTYLYTGNGSTQTITNNIDLSTNGGLVWYKARNQAYNHGLQDTARGTGVLLISNNALANVSVSNYITSFNNNGFTAGDGGNINASNTNYTSWTFRKAKKFFDVVTYSGTGTAKTVTHNLGSVPGCIIVKRTDTDADWEVYHRGLDATNPQNYQIYLNATNARQAATNRWNDTAPTASVFTVGTSNNVNASGGTYVAYLFAHNAGGFGDAGDQSVIKCGSYTGTGSSGNLIDLGWEPQWVLLKRTDGAEDWHLLDNMRGFVVGGADASLKPNLSDAEATNIDRLDPASNGFYASTSQNVSGRTYIYIAIRRGPMKTPEAGTEVFSAVAATGSTGTSRSIGFPADLVIGSTRTTGDFNKIVEDRLRGFANSNAIGAARQLVTNTTDSESTASYPTVYNVWNTTRLDGQYHNSISSVWWHFKRAPGFMDIVCYSGNGTNRTISHNLGVAPELIIIKARAGAAGEHWTVYSAPTGNDKYLELSSNIAAATASNRWNNTSPTASVFSLGNSNSVNGSGVTYVAYLFASVSGVSKVGSYSGTGTLNQIDCGFTSGARFVLIKRATGGTDNWNGFDTARGIVTGNDPYLRLNLTQTETTGDDLIDPYSSGFETSSAQTQVNAVGSTYLYLAIA